MKDGGGLSSRTRAFPRTKSFSWGGPGGPGFLRIQARENPRHSGLSREKGREGGSDFGGRRRSRPVRAFKMPEGEATVSLKLLTKGGATTKRPIIMGGQKGKRWAGTGEKFGGTPKKGSFEKSGRAKKRPVGIEKAGPVPWPKGLRGQKLLVFVGRGCGIVVGIFETVV